MKHRIQAVAQWEINEITIDIQGPKVILFQEPVKSGFIHGAVENAQVALTLKEAKELLSTLVGAIETYENIEKSLEEYFSGEEQD